MGITPKTFAVRIAERPNTVKIEFRMDMFPDL